MHGVITLPSVSLQQAGLECSHGDGHGGSGSTSMTAEVLLKTPCAMLAKIPLSKVSPMADLRGKGHACLSIEYNWECNGGNCEKVRKGKKKWGH